MSPARAGEPRRTRAQSRDPSRRPGPAPPRFVRGATAPRVCARRCAGSMLLLPAGAVCSVTRTRTAQAPLRRRVASQTGGGRGRGIACMAHGGWRSAHSGCHHSRLRRFRGSPVLADSRALLQRSGCTCREWVQQLGVAPDGVEMAAPAGAAPQPTGREYEGYARSPRLFRASRNSGPSVGGQKTPYAMASNPVDSAAGSVPAVNFGARA